jgi:hypothetical protein
LLLSLLVENRFPAIWLPSKELLDLRALLRHRHQWVRIRTRIQNALQAIALANGLRRGPSLWTQAGQQAKSRVVAEIIVVPPDSKKYSIEETTGFGLAERIVRKALDGEVAFGKDSAVTLVPCGSRRLRRPRPKFASLAGPPWFGKT